ncbi:MAG: hypothetical protein IKH34_03805 [Oscillospiraceae bacterium]|nr:hypothetical protein [Oscillospiraceae bacterium]
MVKRYEGNTGRVRRIPEGLPEPPRRVPEPPHREPGPPPPPPGAGLLPRQLQRLLSASLGELETEDLLLLLILYLLYRESGDKDWLVTLGAMLFF